jgi:hypothetical protein
MNAALVARTLSLIPDRVARAQTGSLFDPAAPACCAHPDRITHLARFLSWLGPLNPVTKDDLRIFGLLTPFGKPAVALQENDAESDEDGEGDDELTIDPEPQPLAQPLNQSPTEASHP